MEQLVMTLPPEIEAQMQAISDPIALIRKREIDRGYTIVEDAYWLNKEDWKEFVISWVNHQQVRLVYLYANKQWEGAFKRLVSNMIAANLVPIIIEPLEEMQKILIKWGWYYKFIELPNDRELIFFPPPKTTTK